MRPRRWMILPAAGGAALLIGVLAVNAQTPSPSAGTNYAQVFVNKLAAILHLSPTETQNDLKQAELQTIDQMVKDGQITQAQADALKARVNSGQGLDFGIPFRHGGWLWDRSVYRSLDTAELNAIAGALRLTPAQLQTELHSGKTLSQIEQAQGVSDSAVRSAARNAAKSVLDSAVKAGTITQAQENAILSRIDQGQLLVHGFKHGYRNGQPPQGTPPQSPQNSPQPTASGTL